MTLNVGCVADIVAFTDSSSLNTTDHLLHVGDDGSDFYNLVNPDYSPPYCPVRENELVEIIDSV
jgi:hypothetical protein